MSQYILIIIWIALVYLMSYTINVYTYKNILGRRERRVGLGFAILAVFPLIWWAATRSKWFFDSLLSSKLQKNMSEK